MCTHNTTCERFVEHSGRMHMIANRAQNCACRSVSAEARATVRNACANTEYITHLNDCIASSSPQIQHNMRECLRWFLCRRLGRGNGSNEKRGTSDRIPASAASVEHVLRTLSQNTRRDYNAFRIPCTAVLLTADRVFVIDILGTVSMHTQTRRPQCVTTNYPLMHMVSSKCWFLSHLSMRPERWMGSCVPFNSTTFSHSTKITFSPVITSAETSEPTTVDNNLWFIVK